MIRRGLSKTSSQDHLQIH